MTKRERHQEGFERNIHQNPLVWLATIGFWAIVAIGWRQAYIITSQPMYGFEEKIKLPSFFSTLLFAPIPYLFIHLYKYISQRYPPIQWERRSRVKFILLILLLSIVQGSALFSLSFIMIYGGGLDIMLPNSLGLDILMASFLIPFETFILVPLLTLFTLFISLAILIFSKHKNAIFWIAIPAILGNGILFFKMIFLFAGIQGH